jgi:hypothetical protein
VYVDVEGGKCTDARARKADDHQLGGHANDRCLGLPVEPTTTVGARHTGRAQSIANSICAKKKERHSFILFLPNAITLRIVYPTA